MAPSFSPPFSEEASVGIVHRGSKHSRHCLRLPFLDVIAPSAEAQRSRVASIANGPADFCKLITLPPPLAFRLLQTAVTAVGHTHRTNSE
eukprot:826994-Prymnesium_polylepis.1